MPEETRESKVEFPGDGGRPAQGFLVEPTGAGPYPGVVMIPGVRGHNDEMERLARSLGSEGFQAMAIDLYSHTPDADVSDLQAARETIARVSDRQIVGDVLGAAGYLRGLPHTTGRIGIVGFCAGGRYVYISIAYADGIDAAVACYGPVMDGPESVTGTTDMRPIPPIRLVPLFTAPLLMLNGEEDVNPPPDDVRQFLAELDKHGKTHKQRFFPGVGHGFLDNSQSDRYKPDVASAAWAEELVPWLKHHLA